MGRILMIQNNYSIEPELQKQLEEKYLVHTTLDSKEATNMIDETYFDIFIIMLDDHIDNSTWFFLDELRTIQDVHTPVVFMIQAPSDDLQSALYRNGSWSAIPQTINHQDFMVAISEQIRIAYKICDKIITLEKDGYRYPYRVRDISYIERSGDRKITVYGSHMVDPLETKVEFSYSPGLDKFLVDFGIEREIKQAHQSWLVNTSKVRKARTADMKLILDDGTIIPTSRKHISKFQKKKLKKKGRDDE